MCHESSGWAMGQTIGIGKATVNFDDYADADLIIVMGQNPGTNHPRMLTELENVQGQRRRNRRRQSPARGRPAPVQEPAEGQGHHRPRHVHRGPVPAHPHRRGHGAAAGRLQARARRRGPQNPGTVLDHAFLAEHCEGLEELKEHLSPAGRGGRAGSDRPAHRGDRRTRRPLPEGRQGHHHLGHGHHAAEEGRGHHQGDHQPAPAARQHRQARRRRLPDPRATATSRATAPWASGSRCRSPSWTPSARSSASNRPANTAWTPWKPSTRCATARSRSSWRSAATSSAPSRTPTPPRPPWPNTEMSVQVSTKLNRSHMVTGAEALILPTMGRSEIDIQESGAAVRLGGGHRLRRAPLLGQRGTGLAPPALRTGHPQPPRQSAGRGQDQGRLGRLREELRPDPGPHLAGGGRLRGLQRADPPGRRLHPRERPPRLAHLPHARPARPC